MCCGQVCGEKLIHLTCRISKYCLLQQVLHSYHCIANVSIWVKEVQSEQNITINIISSFTWTKYGVRRWEEAFCRKRRIRSPWSSIMESVLFWPDIRRRMHIRYWANARRAWYWLQWNNTDGEYPQFFRQLTREGTTFSWLLSIT